MMIVMRMMSTIRMMMMMIAMIMMMMLKMMMMMRMMIMMMRMIIILHNDTDPNTVYSTQYVPGLIGDVFLLITIPLTTQPDL